MDLNNGNTMIYPNNTWISSNLPAKLKPLTRQHTLHKIWSKAELLQLNIL